MTRLFRYCFAFVFFILVTSQAANASLNWEHFDRDEYLETVHMTDDEIAALPADWNEHVIAYEVGMRKDWIYLDDGQIISYGILYDSTDDAMLADETNPSEITEFFYFTAEEIDLLPADWEEYVLPYSSDRSMRDWIYLNEYGTLRITYGEYYYYTLWDTWMEVEYFINDIEENMN